MRFVILNGACVDRETARIPSDDAGFLHGDGVFETLRVESRAVHGLDAHLERLCRSLDAIDLEVPWTAADFGRQVAHLLDAEPWPTVARLRITVTRGTRDKPTLLMAAEAYTPPTRAAYERGVAVEISRFVRHPHPLHQVKSTSGAANSWLRREASGPGIFEVLQFNDRGFLAEGSFTNVFLVDGRGTLRTPALDEGCLAGVMRGAVLRLGRSLEIPVEAGSIDRGSLAAAREVFLTNSLIEILPVRTLGGDELQDESRPATRALRAAYEAEVRGPRA